MTTVPRRDDQGGGERPEEARPIFEQIQASNQAALQAAQALLTPEQQAKARELARQLPGAPGAFVGARSWACLGADVGRSSVRAGAANPLDPAPSLVKH